MEGNIEPIGLYNPEIVDAKLLKYIIPNGNPIETIFAPFMAKMFKKSNVIIKCKLEKFKKKFNITSDVLEPMEDIWKNFDVIVAGGKLIDFCNNKTKEESTNDYDMFFISSTPNKQGEYGTSIHTYLTKELKFNTTATLSYVTEYINDNQIKLQTINKVYVNADHILEEFDIRACAICTDGKYVYWVKGAIRDIRDKQLVILNPKNSPRGMHRIVKYIQKGYELKLPDMALISIRFLDAFFGSSVQPDIQQELINRNFSITRSSINMEMYDEMVNGNTHELGDAGIEAATTPF